MCIFIKKETLAQVFSFEFCKISKNTFFTEHPRMKRKPYQIYRNYRSLKQSPPYVSFEIFGLRMPHSSFFIFTERKRGFSFLF